ncbi:hypothetical protein GCM10009037_02570 [Halarchaeum grantii]|uniref:KaiC-like domain-containing protein n=1 Tax=Halarchaeum grantii TaxID=1193105 RepID=A0A830EYF0_9EURY|nr:hypothetical protein [Halarchaeum grantii]GGL22641.1 hypothetical protein GCM10009037_02570 [Halarchaeum grantii]
MPDGPPIHPPESGSQVLAALPPHGRALAHLPESAFENLLVVQTNGAPGRTESAVRERGYDPRRVGVIPVTGSDVSYDGPLWVADRVRPSDLTGLSIQFSNALSYVDSGGWVVFDDLSTLSMYTDAEQLYRFVSTLVNATREADATGLYRVTNGVMDDGVAASIRGTMDAAVER